MLNTEESWPYDEVIAAAAKQIFGAREQVSELYEDVWKHMRTASMDEMKKEGIRRETYQVGDFVYFWIPTELRDTKLAPKCDGPFRVDG